MVKVVKRLVDVVGDCNLYQKRPVKVKAVELVEEVDVHTIEGVLRGYPGDFLIQGVDGGICLCEKDVFLKTYMEVKP